MLRVLIANLVMCYRWLAPQRLRDSCRFHPTCSEYMLQAVEKHGSFKGMWLGLKRLYRCRPPHGGEDFP